jgi:uncharacterized phage protein (TIGR01671 family)
MREIKFRVWDEGMMVPWDDLKEWECNLSELNELRLMQYTGLKDKNGQEIYEGDVCKDSEEHTIGRIKSHPGYFSFMGCVMGIDMLDQGNIQLEVIGNIYENPDLI